MSSLSDFIAKITPGAIQGYKDYGILPSVTIAQAIVESSKDGVPGASNIAVLTNNLFGVTGKGPAGSYTTSDGRTFKKYNSITESILDHNKVVGTLDYYKGISYAPDYQSSTSILQSGGYAGKSTTYAATLNGVIKANNLTSIDNSLSNSVQVDPGTGTISINNGSGTINVRGGAKAPAGTQFIQTTDGSGINTLRPGETPTPSYWGETGLENLNPFHGVMGDVAKLATKVLFIIAGILVGYLAIKYLLGGSE